MLTTAPGLAYPRFGQDASAFLVDVDASGPGLGAVLSQVQEGLERPIAYASRLLADTETRYASTKKELLGLAWSVRHFRCYLLGGQFVIRTDHRSLEHLANFKNPPAIVARWLEFLSEFEFTILYRAGRSHTNADALSRRPDAVRRGREQRRWQHPHTPHPPFQLAVVKMGNGTGEGPRSRPSSVLARYGLSALPTGHDG